MMEIIESLLAKNAVPKDSLEALSNFMYENRQHIAIFPEFLIFAFLGSLSSLEGSAILERMSVDHIYYTTADCGLKIMVSYENEKAVGSLELDSFYLHMASNDPIDKGFSSVELEHFYFLLKQHKPYVTAADFDHAVRTLHYMSLATPDPDFTRSVLFDKTVVTSNDFHLTSAKLHALVSMRKSVMPTPVQISSYATVSKNNHPIILETDFLEMNTPNSDTVNSVATFMFANINKVFFDMAKNMHLMIHDHALTAFYIGFLKLSFNKMYPIQIVTEFGPHMNIESITFLGQWNENRWVTDRIPISCLFDEYLLMDNLNSGYTTVPFEIKTRSTKTALAVIFVTKMRLALQHSSPTDVPFAAFSQVTTANCRRSRLTTTMLSMSLQIYDSRGKINEIQQEYFEDEIKKQLKYAEQIMGKNKVSIDNFLLGQLVTTADYKGYAVKSYVLSRPGHNSVLIFKLQNYDTAIFVPTNIPGIAVGAQYMTLHNVKKTGINYLVKVDIGTAPSYTVKVEKMQLHEIDSGFISEINHIENPFDSILSSVRDVVLMNELHIEGKRIFTTADRLNSIHNSDALQSYVKGLLYGENKHIFTPYQSINYAAIGISTDNLNEAHFIGLHYFSNKAGQQKSWEEHFNQFFPQYAKDYTVHPEKRQASFLFINYGRPYEYGSNVADFFKTTTNGFLRAQLDACIPKNRRKRSSAISCLDDIRKVFEQEYADHNIEVHGIAIPVEQHVPDQNYYQLHSEKIHELEKQLVEQNRQLEQRVLKKQDVSTVVQENYFQAVPDELRVLKPSKYSNFNEKLKLPDFIKNHAEPEIFLK